jgi:hypothetical protein
MNEKIFALLKKISPLLILAEKYKVSPLVLLLIENTTTLSLAVMFGWKFCGAQSLLFWFFAAIKLTINLRNCPNVSELMTKDSVSFSWLHFLKEFSLIALFSIIQVAFLATVFNITQAIYPLDELLKISTY